MCVATNTAGIVRDISSLVVQDDPTPSKNIINGKCCCALHFIYFF